MQTTHLLAAPASAILGRRRLAAPRAAWVLRSVVSLDPGLLQPLSRSCPQAVGGRALGGQWSWWQCPLRVCSVVRRRGHLCRLSLGGILVVWPLY
jgi:hypothetical protein